MRMKYGLAAGASLTAALAFGAAAMADGFSTPVEEPAAPGEDLCFDKGLNDFVPCEEAVPFVGPWSGFYAGVHGGYVGADWVGEFDYPGYESDQDDNLALTVGGDPTLGAGSFAGLLVDLDDLSDSGFGVGAQIGVLHQTPSNWVLGLEGDFTYVVGVDGSLSGEDELIQGQTGLNIDYPQDQSDNDVTAFGAFDTDVEWLASLRMRAGHAFGDFLPFVTGGVGFASYSASVDTGIRFDGDGGESFDYALASGSADGLAVGPVFGGGLEYMITPGMTVRGEALYYIFNEEIEVSDFDVAFSDDLSGDGSLELEDVIVARIALNIKF